jgi:hypothetical protein
VADKSYVVTARKLLNRTFRSSDLTGDEITGSQTDLVQLRGKLFANINRFPAPMENHETDEGFNTWAQVLLSAMSDQYWWFMGSLLLNQENQQLFNDLYPQSVPNLSQVMCSRRQEKTPLNCK